MELFTLLKRFVPPYRGKVVLNVVFNLLSTILSLFSFAAIIPVLHILFGINTEVIAYQEFAWSDEEYVLPGEDMSWVRETGGYYDAGTGFIEYFDDTPPVEETNPIETIFTIALYFLVPAAVIIALIVLIIVLVKKKKKKR